MLFDSFEYIFLFIPAVVILFHLTKKYSSIAKAFLILCGIFFYSYWEIKFLPIILTSIFINYFFGEFLNKYKNKYLLIIFISTNIGILLFFKYYDFLIFNINYLFNSSYEELNLMFPLAISFFTFQQITYLVDSYNQNIKKKNSLDYCLFVIFFPQLIAGPIVRYNNLVSQFFTLEKKYIEYFNKGFLLISIGLFKKLILADYISLFVNEGYNNSIDLNLIEAWLVTICFSFQFYFDFSAYVDLALGSALLLGIKLPINFNSPFKAINMIDFWKRWHITLSNFLNNYIYFPIIRSFKSFSILNSSLTTLFVFLIAGFWHGPSWTFVVFGLIHGLGVVFNQLTKEFNFFNLNKSISIFITFLYVNFSFIFFRSKNFDQAIDLISTMTGIKIKDNQNYSLFDNTNDIQILSLVLLSVTLIWFCKNSNELISSFRKNFKYLFFSVSLFVFSIFFSINGDVFIYFNF